MEVFDRYILNQFKCVAKNLNEFVEDYPNNTSETREKEIVDICQYFCNTFVEMFGYNPENGFVIRYKKPRRNKDKISMRFTVEGTSFNP